MINKILPHDIFDISIESLYQPKLMARAEDAAWHLGQLNDISIGVLDCSYIVTALRNIESLGSAKIEGTTGNLDDLYQEEEISESRKQELKLYSALGYKIGLNNLQQILSDYGKIDLLVLRHLHKIITENDPSTYGKPGILRINNVTIKNSKLGDIEPLEASLIPESIEKYLDLKSDKRQKSLIMVAIGHYQFESIHPFSDGNGRTGRLLVMAYLLYYSWLKEPILNLSNYFEKNRDEYVFRLREVSDKKDYYQWVKFFLKAVQAQSENALLLISKLRKIRDEDIDKVKIITGTSLPIATIDYSLNKLYFTIPDFGSSLEKNNFKLKDPYQTARVNVMRLEKMGILEKSHRSGNADVYCHISLRNILQENN